LLITSYTVHLSAKLANRKFQEEVLGHKESSPPKPDFGEYTQSV